MLTSRHYLREGPDYRFDEQVSFLDIKQQFGFANVRVGKWVSAEESRLAANLIFDSLADLAFILKLPPDAIGLRQTLNLDFGLGGQKGVQAHYAPHERILALAKNAGAGALAHEFWHAFDHYIAKAAFGIHSSVDQLACCNDSGLAYSVGSAIGFGSDLYLKDVELRPHPLNRHLAFLYQTVLINPDGLEPSDYVRRAIALDKHYGRCYFSLPTELMARAFEAAIESFTDIRNQYLVSGTTFSHLNDSGAYPDEAHRKAILNALTNYFGMLGEALIRQSHRESNKKPNGS